MDSLGTGAEWPFNFLPEIEFWALTQSNFSPIQILQNRVETSRENCTRVLSCTFS